MASYFSSIGFPLSTLEQFDDLVEQVLPLTHSQQCGRSSQRVWASDCGAEIVVKETPHEVHDLSPGFVGQSLNSIRIHEFVAREWTCVSPFEGALVGWLEPDEDDPASGECQIIFNIADDAKYRHLSLDTPFTTRAQISAFAIDVTLYPNEAAFKEEQDGGRNFTFAPQSLVPIGLLGFDDSLLQQPSSRVLLNGHVLQSEIHTNALTGEIYYWVLLQSLGGSFDVLIDPKLCSCLPPVGCILSSTSFLVGRVS